ncbi:radical SAM protein [Cereibacter sphaeroides]|jgi:organic radical activating enzyme|uniref:radical SAM protein n=1 Tax=Cereibacter sphaeroides TaxID=1063 RepID=UPI0009B630E4
MVCIIRLHRLDTLTAAFAMGNDIPAWSERPAAISQIAKLDLDSTGAVCLNLITEKLTLSIAAADTLAARLKGFFVMSACDSIDYSPAVLGILLTARCNISCRHCCNCSGPEAEGAVKLEFITGLIDDAVRIGSIREVGLSGGEPFLFLDLVGATLRHARGHGLGASVTTNGFWGRSARADRMLDDLRVDGLTALCISTSQFHQEFIRLNTVVAAAAASRRAGLATTVNVVASAGVQPDTIRDALGDLAGDVGIVVMPCLPTGRAAAKVDAREWPGLTAQPLGNCRYHFQKLAVDLAGDVWPCCSPGGFTPALQLGNANRTPIDRIVARAADSPLLAVLDAVGPAYFLPFLRGAGLADAFPDRFADQCHLCHAMLSDPHAASVVEAACRQLAGEVSQMAAPERPVGRIATIAATQESASV